MKIKSAAAVAVCFAALLGIALAAGVAPLSERVPHGCYPVRLTVQTNADELILQLTGTVPDVSYLVMVRSNKPYSQWLPFTYVIGVTNREPVTLHFSLKSGEADGVMQQTALHHIPARALCQVFRRAAGRLDRVICSDQAPPASSAALPPAAAVLIVSVCSAQKR